MMRYGCYFGKIQAELKQRGLLRTRNITAERGEQIAFQYYNKTSGLPKLELAPPGTRHVDAISYEGERYAIKAVGKKTNSSSTFQADDFKKQRFERLILVRLDEMYQKEQIFEVPWDVINKHKKFDKTMNAYNVPISQKFLSDCTLCFSCN